MKLASLTEAVNLVRAGDTVAFGGMTLYRKPMALVRELIRNAKTDLTFVAFSGSVDADLLAAAGCLSKVRSCYVGLEYLGLAPAIRRETEAQALEFIEETENSIVLGLQAATMDVPYLPARDCCLGTDYFKVRSDLRRAPCPVTGESLTWFPAIKPDVGVLHVPLADTRGNAVLGGERCVDVQIATAARTTILTAEKIVQTEDIRAHGSRAEIVEFMVEAVVHVPGGAHPTSCYPDYQTDVPHLIQYLRTGSDPVAFEDYLSRFVHGLREHRQYIAHVAGEMNQ